MNGDLWILDWNGLPARARQELRGYLVADERDRMAHERFDADRDRYALGRGMLRLILSRYLGIAPGRIELRQTAAGQPVLPSQDLHFSVSHAGSILAVGVSSAMRLGVDIERIPAWPLDAALIDRVCSRAERERLTKLSASDRAAAFIRLWTQKEAYLKALGTGLSLEPDRIEALAHAPDGGGGRIFRDGIQQPGWTWVELELDDYPGLFGAWAAPSDGPLEIRRQPALDLLNRLPV